MAKVDIGYLRLAAGGYNDLYTVHKFGKNDAVGTAIEDIIPEGGVYTWLQTAQNLEAISGSSDDTVAGTGARKVIVEGLDSNFNLISEEIEMNGTDASSPTSQKFMRVHRAYVSETGTYAATTLTASQAGAITIRVASAGAIQISIPAIYNTYMSQSEVARYTIPQGYTGFLIDVHTSADGNNATDLFMFARRGAQQTSTNMQPKRLAWTLRGLTQPVDIHFNPPQVFEQYTDIWFSARASSPSSCEVSFSLVVARTNVKNLW